MPGYSCTVKERMLYSSCKATLMAGCEDVLKMEVAKKVNVNTFIGFIKLWLLCQVLLRGGNANGLEIF